MRSHTSLHSNTTSWPKRSQSSKRGWLRQRNSKPNRDPNQLGIRQVHQSFTVTCDIPRHTFPCCHAWASRQGWYLTSASGSRNTVGHGATPVTMPSHGHNAQLWPPPTQETCWHVRKSCVWVGAPFPAGHAPSKGLLAETCRLTSHLPSTCLCHRESEGWDGREATGTAWRCGKAWFRFQHPVFTNGPFTPSWSCDRSGEMQRVLLSNRQSLWCAHTTWEESRRVLKVTALSNCTDVHDYLPVNDWPPGSKTSSVAHSRCRDPYTTFLLEKRRQTGYCSLRRGWRIDLQIHFPPFRVPVTAQHKAHEAERSWVVPNIEKTCQNKLRGANHAMLFEL